MRLALKVFALCATLAVRVSSQQKDKDEDLPYEFGFTIDGQQHRHEKKDVNGIIQGEFGFITADGVYHVTVYATDENGNFRILSMKNIRISAPLDGSGGPPGQAKQSSALAAQPRSNLPSTPAPPPSSTTAKGYAPFTTQSTIKPACGGCGYVTTPKAPPAQPPKYPFQTPSIKETPKADGGVPQNPNSVENEQYKQGFGAGGSGSIAGGVQGAGQGGMVASGGLQAVGQGGFPGQQGNQASYAPGGPQDVSSLARISPGANKAYTSNTGNQQSYQQSQNAPPQPFPSEFEAPPSPPQPQDYQNQPPQGPNDPPESQNPYPAAAPSDPASPRAGSPLAGVTVSNGAIHVPGNPDIPIQDKYPGMQEGLPRGIEETDVVDLLYKFNYTIGFHGHYEKGYKNGAKVGGYFVNGRDGISRVVTYVADENGYQPKFKFINLGLDSADTPKEESEKSFGLKNFEFVWYPVS